MAAKHTSGPWSVGSSNLPVSRMSIHCTGHANSDHSTIARMVLASSVGIRTDENFANARLLAAAPELLEALEELVSEFGVCGLTEKARAAIAKATGEQG